MRTVAFMKAAGSMASRTATGDSPALKASSTMEAGSTIYSMGRVRKSGPMALSLLVSSSTAKRRAKGSSVGLMVQHTRERSLITNSTVMVPTLGPWKAVSTQDTGQRTACMVKEF